jgi:hypothetical protein
LVTDHSNPRRVASGRSTRRTHDPSQALKQIDRARDGKRTPIPSARPREHGVVTVLSELVLFRRIDCVTRQLMIFIQKFASLKIVEHIFLMDYDK